MLLVFLLGAAAWVAGSPDSLRSEAMPSRQLAENAAARLDRPTLNDEPEILKRQIETLTRRDEQQTARLRQSERQQRWLWTLLVGVALLLAGALVWGWRQRESQRRRQRYLRTLVELLPMRIWFKDAQGRYLVASRACAQADGHGAADMEGRTDAELVPPGQAQRRRTDDLEVMASRDRKTIEERVAAGGEQRWIETCKAAVLDDDGTLLGTVGMARDVSERHAAETARQRSELLAKMSHELRTPLNGILGFAQILRRDTPLTERQARGLKIIDDSGQQLLTLIDDLLDLARIDAATLDLYPVEVNVADFLQVVCDIVRAKADERDLLFTCELAPDLPRSVRVDEKRLRQVLLKLLSNALRFTDAGCVTLRVTRVRETATSRAADPMARLHFEVEDEGIGMDAAQLERLFEPLEAVAEGRRSDGGSGLGLAISRQLVRMMGGDVQVRSRPGAGSAFWFEIEVPTLDAEVRAATGRKPPSGYRGPRRKILVVDDAAQSRAMLVDALGVLGFETAEAENGAQALAVAGDFRPDVVLMDLTMPVMDGFEATRRLRQAGVDGSPVIIAMSASTSPQTAARSLEAGADRFVAKPVDASELFDAIATALSLERIPHDAAARSTQAVDADDLDPMPA